MSGGGRATGAIPDKRMPKWHEGEQPQPGETYTRSLGAVEADRFASLNRPQPMFDPNAPAARTTGGYDGNPLTNNRHTSVVQKQDLEMMMQQAQKAKQTAGLSGAGQKEIGAHYTTFPGLERNSRPTGMSPVYEMPSVRTPRDFMANISTSRRGK
jgi:hypothetical protein